MKMILQKFIQCFQYFFLLSYYLDIATLVILIKTKRFRLYYEESTIFFMIEFKSLFDLSSRLYSNNRLHNIKELTIIFLLKYIAKLDTNSNKFIFCTSFTRGDFHVNKTSLLKIIDSITEILRNQNRVEDTTISKANEVVKAVNFKIH